MTLLPRRLKLKNQAVNFLSLLTDLSASIAWKENDQFVCIIRLCGVDFFGAKLEFYLI